MAELASVAVIIPVYNEAVTIHNNILSIFEYLKVQIPEVTLIVVDDGSKDETGQILSELAARIENIKFIRNDIHRGKGYALLTGARAAQSDVICFLDCDLSIGTNYVKALVDEINSGFDAAIASRFTRGGVNEATLARNSISLMFRIMRRIIIGLPSIADTQCGCKAFKREALATTFSKTVVEGFCYDLELLYLFHKAKYKITEVPIEMHAQAVRKSKVRVLSEGWKTLRDMFLIRVHHG